MNTFLFTFLTFLKFSFAQIWTQVPLRGNISTTFARSQAAGAYIEASKTFYVFGGCNSLSVTPNCSKT